jgi:replication protein C-like
MSQFSDESPERGRAIRPSGARRVTLDMRVRLDQRGTAKPLRFLAAFQEAEPYLGLPVHAYKLVAWLVKQTQPQDWEEGSRPIAWPSARHQAEFLGLSPARVKQLNRALFEAGIFVMRDNERRANATAGAIRRQNGSSRPSASTSRRSPCATRNSCGSLPRLGPSASACASCADAPRLPAGRSPRPARSSPRREPSPTDGERSRKRQQRSRSPAAAPAARTSSYSLSKVWSAGKFRLRSGSGSSPNL